MPVFLLRRHVAAASTACMVKSGVDALYAIRRVTKYSLPTQRKQSLSIWQLWPLLPCVHANHDFPHVSKPFVLEVGHPDVCQLWSKHCSNGGQDGILRLFSIRGRRFL